MATAGRSTPSRKARSSAVARASSCCGGSRMRISDGDRIRAVIKGSAVNNDGSTKVGYLAPSVDGQAKAIREALSVAQVPARSVTYVETPRHRHTGRRPDRDRGADSGVSRGDRRAAASARSAP